MMIKIARLGALCVLVTVLPACAMLKGGKDSSAPLPDSIEVVQGEHEEKLRRLVGNSLGDAEKVNDPNSAKVLFRKPYFYKEYVEYPEGIESYTLDIRESDSQSTPFTARIRLSKKRFATEFKKKKSKARKDAAFYESTGTETRSYEMRHGHWRETGSVFIANNNETRLVGSTASDQKMDEVAEMATADEEPNSGIMDTLLFWRK